MSDLSLLQDFLTEAAEHLEEIESNLLCMETDPADLERLNDLFRSVHTIKGSAEYLGYERISELSHRLENLLDRLRAHSSALDPGMIDVLMEAHDRIGQLIGDLEKNSQEMTDIDDLMIRIERAEAGAGFNSSSENKNEQLLDGRDGVEPPSADKEIYIEEYDQELFDIFIQQLKEDLGYICAQLRRIDAGKDPKGILKLCLAKVEALISSANYMGYDALSDVHFRFKESIESISRLADENAIIDWDQISRSFMDKVVEETSAFFPQCSLVEEILAEAASLEKNCPEFCLADEVSIEHDHKESDPEELFGELDLEQLLDIDDPAENVLAFRKKTENSPDGSLLQDFLTEAVEHLEAIESSLLCIETDPTDLEKLNDIFRSVHTIKGSAEYLGYERIAELSHRLENLLDRLRAQSSMLEPPIIDVLMESRDRIGQLLDELKEDSRGEIEIKDLILKIEQMEATVHLKNATEDEKEKLYENQDNKVSSEVQKSNEVYSEEYDEELFGIFLHQLKENLGFMCAQIRRLDSLTEPAEVVMLCLEKVKVLISSANYMGYDKLLTVFRRLKKSLETTLRRASMGEIEENEKEGWLAIKMFVAETAEFFPQCNLLEEISVISESLEFQKAHGLQMASTSVDCIVEFPERQTASDRFEPSSENQNESAEPGFRNLQLQGVEDDSLLRQLEDAFNAKMTEERCETNKSTEATGFESGLFSDGEVFFLTDLESRSDVPACETDKTPITLKVAEENSDMQMRPDSQKDSLDISCEQFGNGDADGQIEKKIVEDSKNSKSELFNIVGSDSKNDKNTEAALSVRETDSDPKPSFSLDRQRSDRSTERLLKQSIRVDAAKIDSLMNQVGELVVSRAWFARLHQEMRSFQQELLQNGKLDKKDIKGVRGLTFRLSEATVSLGRAANELQEGVMKVRMMPIAQLFNRYPRLVHDLVRETEKKVHLKLKGEDTELDKMVIEEISDPLVHIIRNAVDHGIESARERLTAGKPETGSILLEAYHESNHVVIEVTDDGRGIDLKRIKEKALAKGLVSRDDMERISEKELTEFITIPGFTTVDTVTHTSGRGVGMDVVKKNVEKLNGTIDIDSVAGRQTRIRIKIPLTLAIIPALLVRVTNELFTIPLSTVEETLRIDRGEITTIEGREVIYLRDEAIPLVWLKDLFSLSLDSSDEHRHRCFVVIVRAGTKRLGLVVDALIGQDEVVIKPLEDYLQENSGFSGATILGDGKISLILDVHELMALAVSRQKKTHGLATVM